MNIKNPMLQGVALISLALVVAIVSNGFASRQRKLVLPGFYPNATTVPPRAPDPVPYTPPATVPTATAQQTATGAEIPPASAPAPMTSAAAPAATTTVPNPSSQTPAAPATAASPTAPASAAAPKPQEDPFARFPPHPDKPYVELSGDDVAWLHAHGALFIDARRTSVFEEGHIAGARPFSVWESDVDEKVNALFAERSDPREQNKPIVIYCSGGACEDSHMLAQKLWGVQFNNVYVYRDGYPDWLRRGGATKTGGQP